ncbi:Leucine-rich repeat protein kinase family protein [Raphanus sativus]|uniref:non-specific serine/threonine protein kinase n=1 Tax=Raphanus sativus TaxID=3726 RepID=A0A6J0JVM1_RAPSA|nr:probable LRR receptor-like serine/threonine-protein kinase At1g67720 [Raphanus sativus]XP_018439717.1 probable LRR receptor-like serine/threonine-protein kinase At1g67720 [Raphanus sativus]XP_018439718.1 probable LRR receptor-like serine/threonine-protein kinase At1g67720 [Raphanus sativus]XP_018439719.1 probable LRR receptor-like serine/threonine-protein kinase At1g67720 [Raphanus sativus]KAJ4891804.1 Leucine-rich repeat protein kinase family protein [Raphanus sativus]
MVRDTLLLLCLLVSTCLFTSSSAQSPGFVSLDCGGAEPFTDELGLKWLPDNHLLFGATATISSPNQTKTQYTTLRHFPADDSRKYCYTLNVTSRSRYLIRATFLYGNFDSNNVYPKFDISLGATHWTTVVISDANVIEKAELVFLASSPSVSVCLSNATTGQPFISTLELRQLNGSMYLTEYEDSFHLSVAARINFGAETEDSVRYPDDPYDRIWESDLLKKANYLVDVAAGTKRVSTKYPVEPAGNDRPPEKVMQTAVVGTNGSLTYRMNLEGFPGYGWAFTYFAEIEELADDESRKFRLVLPDQPEYSKAIVNIRENTQRGYKVYEPGYYNITLPYVLNFRFAKTADSSRGPILNAMEISKYLQKSDGSVDATVMANVASLYSSTVWGQEGGDPCLPSPWSWVVCNSDPQPRVVAVKLSNKNLTGDIPSDLTKLTGLVELWLDGNSLTDQIPDFSGCTNLKIIHLENNRLTGKIPSSLAKLPNLTELYLQNNMLSGRIPSGLKGVVSNFTGNSNLGKGEGKKLGVIIGASVGASVLLIATVFSCIWLCKANKNSKRKTSAEFTNRPLHVQRASSTLSDAHGDGGQCFTLFEMEEATKKFEKRIGSGGFGIVYYGKTREGKEIAVKVLGNNSYQGKREFENEVTLLSRIHHRNLVQFLGYCQEEGRNMLVYEFMHNGTLKEHLYGERRMSWIKRLEIAEDAARGIEYLHTGCVPAIIHRDLKTSNILLDKHMRAKVSDFGLSKFAVDGTSHVSSIVRGTVGYLDPEYYISQQLTEKSDVYSFGVILLELISGQEAISNENFGANCRNIVQWAKMHIDNGDIRGIIDPALAEDDYSLQSMWKIAEKALLCVRPHGNMRPSMSEVQKDIQDAIRIEKEVLAARGGLSDEFSRSSAHSQSSSLMNMGTTHDLAGSHNFVSIDESVLQPKAR